MLVALLFFGEIMLKLCSFFQIMPLFLKLVSLKKLQISPKITFFELEAVGLWQFLLVLAFSESPASFPHGMDQAWPTPFCNL